MNTTIVKSNAKVRRVKKSDADAATKPSEPQANASPAATLGQMTEGMHTFHVADSAASYPYTDDDVAKVTAAYTSEKQADELSAGCASIFVRIFGEKALTEADSEARKALREWLYVAIPEAAEYRSRQQKYAASKAALGQNNGEAAIIRTLGKAVADRITRIIRKAERAWEDHKAALSDALPEVKSKTERTAIKILEKCHQDLEKRAERKRQDQDAAKRSAAVVGQLPERVGLFLAVMKCGARLKLTDEQMIDVLRFLNAGYVSATLQAAEEAKAAEEAAKKAKEM